MKYIRHLFNCILKLLQTLSYRSEFSLEWFITLVFQSGRKNAVSVVKLAEKSIPNRETGRGLLLGWSCESMPAVLIQKIHLLLQEIVHGGRASLFPNCCRARIRMYRIRIFQAGKVRETKVEIYQIGKAGVHPISAHFFQFE